MAGANRWEIYPRHVNQNIICVRDEIRSSGKFAIHSSFKIGGREGVQ